jgi:hypothetical protein
VLFFAGFFFTNTSAIFNGRKKYARPDIVVSQIGRAH